MTVPAERDGWSLMLFAEEVPGAERLITAPAVHRFKLPVISDPDSRRLVTDFADGM